MNAYCTLRRTADNSWCIHHSSATLGDVELTGSTRAEALTKMQNELQYRMEWCPCTGDAVGQVELDVREESSPGPA